MNLLLPNQVRRCGFSIIYLLPIVCGLLLVEPVKSAPYLESGDSGGSVIELQKALSQKGFYTGSLDGYYGEETKQAVIKFQQVNHLSLDGIAGGQTQSVLQGGLSLAPQTVAAQAFSQAGAGSPGSIFAGLSTSEILGLITFSGVIASVAFQSGASRKVGNLPFKQRFELCFRERHLADLGLFDIDTPKPEIALIHEKTKLSANSATSTGNISITDPAPPKGEYTYVVEGIYNGEKVTRKGTFKL
ncbi:peptidoglycan-binding domain-containing protein [Stenomitos frigidus]|uniref:Peptidoglycan binding-like domain-containing protein n=1 Tax=Stenomitos frigidus ULC18 TaxID=2107698 RepID=A0A2T1EM22_9CYAN|nr:peptidoglycan-binding domain-containing protein [Stenomitos frigidus]PSB33753.1 hypothetical protein C7B82_04280 [Stenomitos frigidus ULC18]